MALRHQFPFFVMTIPGLAPFVAREASQLGVAARIVGTDGRADVIAVNSNAPELRTAESAFRFVADIPLLRDARATTAGLPRVHRPVRVIVRLRDERHFRRTELRNAIERHLGTRATRDESAPELWVSQLDRRLLVGLRITVPRRGRTAERHGALRPAVAAAMAQLTAPRARVVDPCCGTGTILRAARDAVGGDIDPAALAAAHANGARGLVSLDARRLPFATDSFDAVVTNLPFGRQHQVQGSPIAWYRKVLQESLRVAPQAVVLAVPTAPFRQALGRVSVGKLDRYDIDLLGNRTSIWNVRR